MTMIKIPVRCEDCGARDRENMYRLDAVDPRMFCGNCARLRALAKVNEMFPAPRPVRPVRPVVHEDTRSAFMR